MHRRGAHASMLAEELRKNVRRGVTTRIGPTDAASSDETMPTQAALWFAAWPSTSKIRAQAPDLSADLASASTRFPAVYRDTRSLRPYAADGRLTKRCHGGVAGTSAARRCGTAR